MKQTRCSISKHQTRCKLVLASSNEKQALKGLPKLRNFANTLLPRPS